MANIKFSRAIPHILPRAVPRPPLLAFVILLFPSLCQPLDFLFHYPHQHSTTVTTSPQYFRMSAAQILETLTISQEKVLETLKEAADLLCNCHTHDIAPLAINPGEFVELYILTIDCGEGDIIWLVEMWPNCRFKTIKRCKRVTIPNSKFIRGSNALYFSLRLRIGAYSRV